MKWILRILFAAFIIATMYLAVNFGTNLKYFRFYEFESLPYLQEGNKDKYIETFFTSTSVNSYVNDPIYTATSLDNDMPFDLSIYNAKQSIDAPQSLVIYFDDRNINDLTKKINYDLFVNDKNNYNADNVLILLSIYFDDFETPVIEKFNSNITLRFPVEFARIKDGKIDYSYLDENKAYVKNTANSITKIKIEVIDQYLETESKTTQIGIINLNENSIQNNEIGIKDSQNIITFNNFNGSVNNLDNALNYSNDINIFETDLTKLKPYNKYIVNVVLIYSLFSILLTFVVFFYKPLKKHLENKKLNKEN